MSHEKVEQTDQYSSKNTTTTTKSKTNPSATLQRVRDKVMYLDVLVGGILGFVDLADLGTAGGVCTVWRDTAAMTMFWLPFLQRRWGSLLPMESQIYASQPKQTYCTYLHAEKNVMKEATYQTTRIVMDSKETPLCMQFDGDTLMSGHIDKYVHIYDLKTGEIVNKIKGHDSWVKCLQFDDHVLITGSYDSTIKEWDRSNNEYNLIKEYEGHGSNGLNHERSPRGSVVCLQFDERVIVSGSNDTTLRVWNRQTGLCEQIISGHNKTVRCLEFRNHICFSGGSDRCIKSFDLHTGQSMTEFVGHLHRISCVQMHRTNANIVISGSNDRTARIWDSRVGSTAIALVAEHTQAIRRLQFDGVKLITGGDDNVIRAWDMRTLSTNCLMNSNQGTGESTWESLAGSGFSSALGATRALSCFTSSDPAHKGRVSALQFDCTRLAVAFTLGNTKNGVHQRRGSIKIWNFNQVTEAQPWDLGTKSNGTEVFTEGGKGSSRK